MTMLEKQKAELVHSVDLLRSEEERLMQASEIETQRISEDLETRVHQLQQQITGLESNKREIQEDVERLERDEATLRCSIEELQHESQLLSQRISQMKESVLDAGRKRVSWGEDKVGCSIRGSYQPVHRDLLTSPCETS
jgi:chromosome segregation ATPase